jgi:hypothetical protein
MQRHTGLEGCYCSEALIHMIAHNLSSETLIASQHNLLTNQQYILALTTIAQNLLQIHPSCPCVSQEHHPTVVTTA